MIILAKRLSENQKNEIIKCFTEGETIEELSKKFNFTKLTISRNLKKYLGEKKYKNLFNKNKSENISFRERSSLNNKENSDEETIDIPIDNEIYQHPNSSNEEIFDGNQFIEITPLDYQIDKNPQKDLSSLPIKDVTLPKVLYMIVNKNIELETKFLKDYPEWQFLPQKDLNRKTIEVYEDLKVVKRFCGKDQKVIKVPNTNVFRIAAPILIRRGISRIIISEQLISL